MKALAHVLLACLVLVSSVALAKPANTPLREGVHYELTDVGPYAAQPGKIEVVEVFGYTCGHCARFETVLHPWVQQLPTDVVFNPVPAAFGGFWDPWARAYLAARQLGVDKASHQDVFNAIHVSRQLPASGITPAALGSFYASYGVKATEFESVLRSEKVQRELLRARQYAIDGEVVGTPTMIINGKYRVLGDSFEQMLRNAEALIERERSAQK